MLTLRAAQDRGHVKIDWLDARHSFSFGEYYDPRHMGFRTLRVINHDFIAPASGFPTHGHRDMEIITYVVSAAVEHQDSLGNKEQILAGEVQVMSAGRGIRHSEVNPDKTKTLELLQIWIEPETKALQPSYQQRKFTEEMKKNKLCLIASRNGEGGGLTIHQDVSLFASILEPGQTLDYSIASGRALWLQIVSGELVVSGQKIVTGDGLAVENEKMINITANKKTDFLLFDLT